LTCLLV